MASGGVYGDRYESIQDVLRRLDGVERVELLPRASLVAIAPGASVEEPVYVFVEWAPSVIERPYPGSAIWRAALQHYLDRPRPDDPAYHALRPIVEGCLARFPDLAAWLRWLDRERTVPEAPPGDRAHQYIWPGIMWPW